MAQSEQGVRWYSPLCLGRCYLLHVHPRVSAFVGEGAHHGDKPNPLWACFGTETLVLEQFPKSDLMHSAA